MPGASSALPSDWLAGLMTRSPGPLQNTSGRWRNRMLPSPTTCPPSSPSALLLLSRCLLGKRRGRTLLVGNRWSRTGPRRRRGPVWHALPPHGPNPTPMTPSPETTPTSSLSSVLSSSNIRKYPTTQETLEWIKDNGRYSGEWEENETKRAKRVQQILRFTQTDL